MTWASRHLGSRMPEKKQCLVLFLGWEANMFHPEDTAAVKLKLISLVTPFESFFTIHTPAQNSVLVLVVWPKMEGWQVTGVWLQAHLKTCFNHCLCQYLCKWDWRYSVKYWFYNSYIAKKQSAVIRQVTKLNICLPLSLGNVACLIWFFSIASFYKEFSLLTEVREERKHYKSQTIYSIHWLLMALDMLSMVYIALKFSYFTDNADKPELMTHVTLERLTSGSGEEKYHNNNFDVGFNWPKIYEPYR